MEPDEYFPRHYRDDVRVFWGSMVHPHHGPWWMLCGRTLERLFRSGQREKYADPEQFLCALWLLNLTHQGIRTYFPDVYQQWILFSESFPDLRGCHFAHGGVRTPGSLLVFARDPSYIRAKPLELDERRVRAFLYFFFNRYLGQLTPQDHSGIREFSPAELLGRLRDDPDCPEVSRYA